MVVCVNLKYLLLMGINEYITKNHKRLLDIAKNVTKMLKNKKQFFFVKLYIHRIIIRFTISLNLSKIFNNKLSKTILKSFSS